MTDKIDNRTAAVRAGLESDERFGAVMPPIYLTSNFAFEAYDRPRGYDYTRTGNPTRDALADALAELEGGAGATITGSGMAAAALVCQLVDPGQLVLAPVDCYGGTFRLLSRLSARGLLNVRFIDQTDESVLQGAIAEQPRLIWVETPTNPLLRVIDLKQMNALAKQCGALLVVDNTFLSPALLRPIEFGADLVMHSTTNYLNGPSDVLGGAVIAATPQLHEQMQDWSNILGLSGSALDSFLTMRGIRTLHVRLRQHEENALAIADVLQQHQAVAHVYYPGLASDPGHQLARQQQNGFGGMISFDLKGGARAAAEFIAALKLFTLAVSLGGVESLVCHPATMSHAAMDDSGREAAGIGAGLIRLSVGIEATADLVADIQRSLNSLSA